MPDPAFATPPAVITFAASDPTSGAGLQADILTLASMGCHPLSVITAITVQDTAGVESFLAIDPDWVAARKASEEKGGGSLTAPDGVKSVYMKATDYSPTK